MNLALLIVLDSLANGALIFFAAVGLTLIYSVLRVLNVAHGSFYSIGSYVAAISCSWFLSLKLNPYLTIPLLFVDAMLIAALLGPLTERYLIRWTYQKPESAQLLVTFGLFLVLENLQDVVFGSDAYSETTPLEILGNSEFASVTYPNYQLLLVAVAIVVWVGLRYALAKSRIGRLTTAVVVNREVALSQGVNADRVFMIAFTIGIFFAAVGGVLAAPMSGASPGLGGQTMVLAFAVASIGGLGQVTGAFLGALIVGVAEVVALYFFPLFDSVMPYLVMLLVLLFRPNGLFSVSDVRKI